ncbi:hypothetical protein [Halobaculum sp. P14]|uniref:hypothetical protein n=1 Tax=Halobaculum sp. P14 TaxID=3421638 RepID=UPI003EC13A71
MPEGQVAVRERGEEAIIETPSLDREIRVDLDGGGSGEANVHVPTGTATVHDDSLGTDEEEADTATTDGGYARPTERVTLRGTGLDEEQGWLAGLGGIACVVLATLPSAAPWAAGVAGLSLAYLGARAKFGLAATGGDDA